MGERNRFEFALARITLEETAELANMKLEENEVKRLVEAVRGNNTMKELRMKDCEYDGESWVPLPRAFNSSETLVCLDLTASLANIQMSKLFFDELKSNEILTSLNLSWNNIGEGVVDDLAVVLQSNRTLTSLDLSNNKVRDVGATAIAKAISFNPILSTLVLKRNEVGDEGSAAIANALKGETGLTVLDLSLNLMGVTGAGYLADVLKRNTNLTCLLLGSNRTLGYTGAQSIAAGLQGNKAITSVDLSACKLGDEGASAFAELLECNESLTQLDLSLNSITDDGFARLADGLKWNTGLKTLILDDNHFSEMGARSIAHALNTNTSLDKLSLAGRTLSKSIEEHFDGVLKNRSQGKRDCSVVERDNGSDTEIASTYRSFLQLRGQVLVARSKFESVPVASLFPEKHLWSRTAIDWFTVELSKNPLEEILPFLELYDRIQTQEKNLECLQNHVKLDISFKQKRNEARLSLLELIEKACCSRRKKFVEKLEREFRHLQENVSSLDDVETENEGAFSFPEGMEEKNLSFENESELLVVACSFNQEYLRVSRQLQLWAVNIRSWESGLSIKSIARSSDAKLLALRKYIPADDPTKQFEFFCDPFKLASLNLPLKELCRDFSAELRAINAYSPMSDVPIKQMKLVVTGLNHFIKETTLKFERILRTTMTSLERRLDSLRVGLTEPDTTKVEALIDRLYDLEESRDGLRMKLNTTNRNISRGKGSMEDLMAEKKKLEEELSALSGFMLSKERVKEAARVLSIADAHYPELIIDEDWKKKVGINNMVDKFELQKLGLFLDGVSLRDLVVEKELSSSDARAVQLVHLEGQSKKKVLKLFSLVNATAQEYFVRQSRVVASLRNTNVVQIEGVFVDSETGKGCILMPFYERGDLAYWLQNTPDSARELPFCKQIACDILNGLVSIHSKKHVHCDLKPSNIFLTKGYRALIGDFDGVKKEDRTVTNLHSTAQYLAPEIKDGLEDKVGTKADMYSFGKILEELLSFHDSEEKDELLASLLHENSTKRPNALDVLQNSFFSSQPGEVWDCMLCLEQVPECQAIKCPAGHISCHECINRWVWSKIAVQAKEDSSTNCFLPQCKECLSFSLLTTCLNPSNLLVVQNIATDEMMKRQQEEHDKQLEKERSKSNQERLLSLHQKKIENDILTLCCPRCRKAFVDFSDCFAVTCRDETNNGCGCKFCAWCLEDCGDDDETAHHHVANCSRNRTPDQGVFGNERLRIEAMKTLRSERVNKYWREFVEKEEEEVREKLYEIIRNHYQSLDKATLIEPLKTRRKRAQDEREQQVRNLRPRR